MKSQFIARWFWWFFALAVIYLLWTAGADAAKINKLSTVRWTPAIVMDNGVPLALPNYTAIRVTDCASEVKLTWRFINPNPTETVSYDFRLPNTSPCECVLAATVVPSLPVAQQWSAWTAPVQQCNGGGGNSGCH